MLNTILCLDHPGRQRQTSERGKHYLLIYTNWFLLHVLMHEVNIQDYYEGKLLCEPLEDYFPCLERIWAYSWYKKGGFCEWIKAILGRMIEIVEHPWSSSHSVWITEGVQADWEKIRLRGSYAEARDGSWSEHSLDF